MHWFKRETVLDGPEASTDDAADTLAAVLRALGHYAIGLDALDPAAFRAACDDWALHVTAGTPAPIPNGHARIGGGTRDWPLLQAFVEDARRREQRYVTQTVRTFVAEQQRLEESLSALRDLIATLVDRLGGALAEDADDPVTSQLDDLRSAVQHEPPDSLRALVLATVDRIQAAAEARRERRRAEHAQLAELGAKVATLAGELHEARRRNAIDPLTSVANRATLDDAIDRAIHLHALFGQPATLLMIDVDNFKSINDRHGHPAGDALLKLLADQLTRSFPRKSDCVARYGGDEFAVVLADAGRDAAHALASRFLDAARTLDLDIDGTPVPLRLSIGLSSIIPDDTTASWVARTDSGLYLAKQQGKDRVAVA